MEKILKKHRRFCSIRMVKKADRTFVAATFGIADDVESNPLLFGCQQIDGMPTALQLDCNITSGLESLNCADLCNDITREMCFGKVFIVGKAEALRYGASHLFVGPSPNEQVVHVLVDEALNAQVSTCVTVARLRRLAKTQVQAGTLFASVTPRFDLN